MNRARQAEITQEILEVVAGADALSVRRWEPRGFPRPLPLVHFADGRLAPARTRSRLAAGTSRRPRSSTSRRV